MKEKTFAKEDAFLSQYATKSNNSRGRLVEEEPCPMRTDFQRDRDRIIYSKAFRRLKNKTQVFLSPEGDHFITRLTHTLDVAQVARSICRYLNLNEDLAEAIALGHDLGHTPFGHSGERCLNKLNPKGFEHNVQSLRVVDVLEREGKGLNLTFEVRDGIVNHKTTCHPCTLEGQAVSLSDRIAYINHDIDDAIRAGIITESDIPERAIKLLGKKSSARIDTMIRSICHISENQNFVRMEDDVFSATEELRSFMFERVYNLNSEYDDVRAYNLLSTLYDYFMKKPEKMPEFYIKLMEKYDKEDVICDYLSSMTDRYAISVFENIFIPKCFMLGENS